MFILLVEGQPTWQRNNAGLDTRRLELAGSLDSDGDLGSTADDGEVSLEFLMEDVSATDGLLNARALEVGEILAGEGKDRGSPLGLEAT